MQSLQRFRALCFSGGFALEHLGRFCPFLCVVVVASCALPDARCERQVIHLKNGMVLRGDHFRIAGINENVLAGGAGASALKLVLVVDDGLRRTFVSKYQFENAENDPERLQSIRLNQVVADQGGRIGRIGATLGATPFDQFGIRTYSLVTPKGTIPVIQGITEISPLYTRIQGLKGSNPHVWDMRVATSSIPRDVLSRVLHQHLGADDEDQRLSIVKLYLQSERYQDAERELQGVIRDFPGLKNLKQQITAIKQLKANSLLDEIKRLRDAGQHKRVMAFLQNFPTDGIANAVLIEVQEILREYEVAAQKGGRVQQLIAASVDQLEPGPRRDKLLAFQDELDRDLGFDTLGRLTAFLNLADDEQVIADKKLTDEQKLSLALSGWILGSENSVDNLAVSVSLIEVRKLVLEYLTTDSKEATRRQEILDMLKSLEGASPERVSQLLRYLRPPRQTEQLKQQLALASGVRDAEIDGVNNGKSESSKRGNPKIGQGDGHEEGRDRAGDTTKFGTLEITATTPTGEVEYVVQLPPEYHHYRRYPAVVSLHASGATAEMEIEWWAGTYQKATHTRRGQAGRHGYIVIAPKWAKNRQRAYQYSVAEHAAVLSSLRDAIMRFSIDTDRVFLSGHEIGGDAAWDIGLAHPDLWAGVIPIGAISDYGKKRSPKYVLQYWGNAKHVPLYFVGGELAERKPSRNEIDLDRYLRHTGFDAMVVEYLGRGNESFSDEILRIFEWMELHERDFYPHEFSVSTMRSWDSFFWWIEVDGIPSRSQISPFSWPQKNVSPMTVESEIKPKNGLSVKSSSAQTTVWFSPEMLDLNQPVRVRLNASLKPIDAPPNLETLLEDVRSRGDRQHPFWAKATFQTGRKEADR